jgi:hypothetical protein
MLNLNKLLKKPMIFERLTGLTPGKFRLLVQKLEPIYQTAELKRKSRPNRKRKIGAGPKPALSLAEDLFMLLVYYRTYLTHVFLGLIMNIDDSNVGRHINKIKPLLAQIFKIPERRIRITEEEVLELIVDATEQETEKRKGSSYSGKKKRQTVKTQIITDKKGKIKSISKSVPGNVHDKKLYDQTRAYTNRKVKWKGDLGYVGTSLKTPIKKQKHKELTEKQKQYNKRFSKKRIVIEHTIAQIKKFRILSNRFRNPLNGYSLVFKNVVGVLNYAMA